MIKKGKFILLAFIVLSFVPIIAHAKTIVTSNKIEMEENLYKRLCDIYSQKFVDTMTLEEFNLIANNNLDEIEKVTSPQIMTLGTIHSTSSKSLTIIKNGTTITIELDWLVVPKVKNYDVMGARFSGTVTKSNLSFRQVYYDNGFKTDTACSTVNLSNGFGVSFKVKNGTNHSMYLTFTVSGSGNIYGSYQHATSSTITQLESLSFDISSNGYGGVFNFKDSVKDRYDAMGGVSLTI